MSTEKTEKLYRIVVLEEKNYVLYAEEIQKNISYRINFTNLLTIAPKLLLFEI